MQTLHVKCLAAAMLLLSSATQADWSLDDEDSTLHYVTTKAAAVAEVNTFTGLSGAIDATEASLEIDLDTVNTAVEIRDQRMREILFQTDMYPTATVTVPVEVDVLDAMPAGAMAIGTYNVTVNLHGVSTELPVDLQVIKLDADTLVIHLAKPLLIGAATFGLAAGVEQLREVAALASISPTVSVDFSLVYRNE